MANRSQLIAGLATALMEDGIDIEMPSHFDRSTGTFYIQGSKVTRASANRAIRYFEEKALACPNSVKGNELNHYYNIAIASIKKCMENDEQEQGE